jgi:hypothetical protein
VHILELVWNAIISQESCKILQELVRFHRKKRRNENNFSRSKQPLRSLCDARCLTRMIRPAVIDTCKEMNPCPASAKCVNTEGGHKCSCPRGRRPKGDGSGGCEIDYSMPAIGMQSSFLFIFLPLRRHRHCFR